jgi:hypothetical protein
LKRRKVIKELLFYLQWQCGDGKAHFVGMPFNPRCLGGSEKIFQKRLCVRENFVGVLEYLMGRCSVMELELAGVIAWRIWKRRNSVLHGGEFLNPAKLVTEAEDMLASPV